MQLRSLSVTALLLLGACDAIQPKPLCRAQPAKYAARYAVDGSPQGACTGKILTGEILNLQYYRPKQSEPNGTPSVAIEPESVFQAVKASMSHQGMEYSQGRYLGYEPGDDDVCQAPELSETSITAGMTQLSYRWSAFKMLVTPLSNAIHFGADLTRKDGDCTVKYKVTAIYPAVPCGTGTDHTTGTPDNELCKPVQGNGISPDIELVCDASADGLSGTHLCVPKGDFPAVKR